MTIYLPYTLKDKSNQRILAEFKAKRILFRIGQLVKLEL